MTRKGCWESEDHLVQVMLAKRAEVVQEAIQVMEEYGRHVKEVLLSEILPSQGWLHFNACPSTIVAHFVKLCSKYCTTQGSYNWKPPLWLYGVDYYHLSPFCNDII